MKKRASNCSELLFSGPKSCLNWCITHVESLSVLELLHLLSKFLFYPLKLMHELKTEPLAFELVDVDQAICISLNNDFNMMQRFMV